VVPAAALAAAVVVLPAACRLVWALAGRAWADLSARLIASVIAEKGASARPAAEYEQFMAAFYERMGALFSYSQAHTLASVLLAVSCLALVLLAVRRKITRPVFLVLFFALAVVDLHHYGWALGTGFIGNTDRIERTLPDERIAFLQKVQMVDPGPMAEFVLDPADEFLPPNRSMAYGLSHAGGYSPLLLKDYYDLTADLGIVDGSLGHPPHSEDVWLKNRGVLDLIGLKYLASDAALQWPGFEQAGRIGQTIFYRNQLALPAAAAWTHAIAIPDAAERLKYLKSSAYDPRSIAVVERDPGLPATPGPGVFSNAQVEDWRQGSLRAIFVLPADGIGSVRVAAYPGWVLRVDGQFQPWFRVNHAFIGFRLEAGAHVVELNYLPNHYREALILSAVAGLLVLAAAFRFFLAAKPL
jgi:hypothetical protein